MNARPYQLFSNLSDSLPVEISIQERRKRCKKLKYFFNIKIYYRYRILFPIKKFEYYMIIHVFITKITK